MGDEARFGVEIRVRGLVGAEEVLGCVGKCLVAWRVGFGGELGSGRSIGRGGSSCGHGGSGGEDCWDGEGEEEAATGDEVGG